MAKKIIISPKWLFTLEEENLITGYSVIINGNKISDIISNDKILSIDFDEHIKLNNHVLMPGLVNLHAHSAMSLLRGKADDLFLADWLKKYIWPMEKKFVNEDFVYDGSLLAMAEMVRGGITTINDMYFYHSSVAKAGIKMGLRTFIGCTILEFPTNYAQNSKEYINKALESIYEFSHNSNDNLINFTLAPHAPYSVSDDTFKKISKMSEEKELLIHSHIHETKNEINESLKLYNKRPIKRLDELGILNNCLIAAHMVHLTNEEISLSSKKNISISHNPSSNMKLSSGFARVQDMLNKEINVGIGTDSSVSNNKLDLIAEIRLASLISKGFFDNPTNIKAIDAIKMATLNGAKALHIEDKIGTIKINKLADLIAIDLSNLETQPIYNIISNIVYSSGRENITHVWVNGKMLMKDRILQNIEVQEINRIFKKWENKINNYLN